MSGTPRTSLSEALLQAGVAPRHARRAEQEVSGHFEDLVAAAQDRGETREDAEHEAVRLLGTQADLIRSYTTRPELRAWSRRHPLLAFSLLPLLTYAAIGAGTLLLFALWADLNSAHLHQLHIPAYVSRGIEVAAQIIFLWLLPALVGCAFALLAHRRRAPAQWSTIAIIGVSFVAALCNVAVSITSGDTHGEVGFGIGIASDTLPEHLGRTALLALPLLLLMRLACRPSPNLDVQHWL